MCGRSMAERRASIELRKRIVYFARFAKLDKNVEEYARSVLPRLLAKIAFIPSYHYFSIALLYYSYRAVIGDIPADMFLSKFVRSDNNEIFDYYGARTRQMLRAYKKICQAIGNQPPVDYYRVHSELINSLCDNLGVSQTIRDTAQGYLKVYNSRSHHITTSYDIICAATIAAIISTNSPGMGVADVVDKWREMQKQLLPGMRVSTGKMVVYRLLKEMINNESYSTALNSKFV